MKAFKAGKLGEVGKTQRPLTEIEMELAWTKRELAEVKIERDILKKGKVSKQPPRYERMVAWDGQRNARDAVTVRVG